MLNGVEWKNILCESLSYENSKKNDKHYELDTTLHQQFTRIPMRPFSLVKVAWGENENGQKNVKTCIDQLYPKISTHHISPLNSIGHAFPRNKFGPNITVRWKYSGMCMVEHGPEPFLTVTF